MVLYFCDNGPNGVRWNGDMKGRKGSTDEGGVRSPLLVRWPAKIPSGKTVPYIGAAVDLLPTLADLAQVELISKQPLDGMSLAELLTTDRTDWPDREIISTWNGRLSVRNQRFRLDNGGALFELAADPGQRQNVARQFPEVTDKLTRIADQYRQAFKDSSKDQRPFLLGHADYKYTQIPARDGTASGSIQRSNKFPNCSFFTNWVDVGDHISWQVEVASAGSYQVDVQYTCPAEDVGSTIELSCGASRLTSQISVAHDPPLRGQEHDRVPRMESYVKDFRTMNMGTIQLAAGPATLKLSATNMPGKQVMDFRLLMFTKVD
jgi:hypothetical protein